MELGKVVLFVVRSSVPDGLEVCPGDEHRQDGTVVRSAVPAVGLPACVFLIDETGDLVPVLHGPGGGVADEYDELHAFLFADLHDVVEHLAVAFPVEAVRLAVEVDLAVVGPVPLRRVGEVDAHDRDACGLDVLQDAAGLFYVAVVMRRFPFVVDQELRSLVHAAAADQQVAHLCRVRRFCDDGGAASFFIRGFTFLSACNRPCQQGGSNCNQCKQLFHESYV